MRGFPHLVLSLVVALPLLGLACSDSGRAPPPPGGGGPPGNVTVEGPNPDAGNGDGGDLDGGVDGAIDAGDTDAG